MGELAIRIQNMGKRYRIGQRERYHTLRDFLARAARRPLKSLRGTTATKISNSLDGEPKPDHIWALKEVSFDVKQGEVVGLIGRNGAGKTTLLKILSRVTHPTTGSAEVYGRLGSLLEVGTGFHPELTGSENIYLSGAILGMKKREIAKRFDEIVAFAEVEKFIDTPVKRYSSGMYLRLAFAVAAHLEPEILLVDEVLAVGDAAFQKKCIGKMEDVAGQGRTVLLVSHTMAAVQSLCTRGVVLRMGRVEFDGPIEEALYQYVGNGQPQGCLVDLTKISDRGGSGDILLTTFRIENKLGTPEETLLNGQPYTFILGFQVQDPVRSYDNVAVTITVKSTIGSTVFYHHNLLTDQPFNKVNGKGEFCFHVPRLPLSPGHYYVDLDLSRDQGRTIVDTVQAQASFQVCDGDFFGTGFEYRGGRNAVVAVDGTWSYDQR